MPGELAAWSSATPLAWKMEDGKIKSDVAMSSNRQGPLSRFKVIDLTRARAGPTAARHFADWGADVIKVEMPQEGDDDPMMGGSRHGPDFFNLHRNKRSITLNLKTADGVPS